MQPFHRSSICCSARFLLSHAVWANQSGKTVLFFAGLTIFVAGDASDLTRGVCAANAIGMILGQLWYTKFWTLDFPSGGINEFMQDDRRHLLHVISKRVLCGIVTTAAWMFAASLYYVGFTAAFFFAASTEPLRLVRAYCVVAGVWHDWILALLLGGAAIRASGCDKHDLESRGCNHRLALAAEIGYPSLVQRQAAGWSLGR